MEVRGWEEPLPRTTEPAVVVEVLASPGKSEATTWTPEEARRKRPGVSVTVVKGAGTTFLEPEGPLNMAGLRGVTRSEAGEEMRPKAEEVFGAVVEAELVAIYLPPTRNAQVARGVLRVLGVMLAQPVVAGLLMAARVLLELLATFACPAAAALAAAHRLPAQVARGEPVVLLAAAVEAAALGQLLVVPVE